MTDYIAELLELATTKKLGWQQSECPVVRTTRKETEPAWREALKYSRLPEDELFKKCELAIQAQALFRRDDRASGGKPPQPKMLSAWLRAGRWEESIGSHAELKERAKLVICDEPGCTYPVHGPKFSKCTDHEGRKRGVLLSNELNESYKKHKDQPQGSARQALMQLTNTMRRGR